MKERDEQSRYLNFFAMIATAMVAMFILMYVHSYQVF